MGQFLCYYRPSNDNSYYSSYEQNSKKMTCKNENYYPHYIKIENIVNSNMENEGYNSQRDKKNHLPTFESSKISSIHKNDNINKSNCKIGQEDFEILKIIGRGSFGKVMFVQRKCNGKQYAMKIIRKDFIKKRNQITHTLTEKNILKNNQSPFIVSLHFAFQTPERLFLIMDFMRGGELFFHLRRSKRFSESKARFYISEIILAIEYLHKNKIIYRDLKPENVLLDEEGHIRITDFGLSKEGISKDEKTFSFCGTPEYLAPEILLGIGHDKSVDWWSLGALLYEMLAGEPPFNTKDKKIMYKQIFETPINMKPFFSLQTISLLLGLLCLDPEKRLGGSSQDANEIKNHPFFKDVDWELMEAKQILPPFKPNIENKHDLTNFSKHFTEENYKETPINLNFKFREIENYSNFSYFKSVESPEILEKKI